MNIVWLQNFESDFSLTLAMTLTSSCLEKSYKDACALEIYNVDSDFISDYYFLQSYLFEKSCKAVPGIYFQS